MKRLQATNLLICQHFLTSRSFLSLKPLDSYAEDFKSGSQLNATQTDLSGIIASSGFGALVSIYGSMGWAI